MFYFWGCFCNYCIILNSDSPFLWYYNGWEMSWKQCPNVQIFICKIILFNFFPPEMSVSVSYRRTCWKSHRSCSTGLTVQRTMVFLTSCFCSTKQLWLILTKVANLCAFVLWKLSFHDFRMKQKVLGLHPLHSLELHFKCVYPHPEIQGLACLPTGG